MDTTILLNIIKNCKPGQKIEIDPISGEIRVIWHNKEKNNKKQHKKVGNLFSNINEIIPLRTKTWVNINRPAFEKYRDFGVRLKKQKQNSDILLKAIRGVFETFVNMKDKSNKYVDENGIHFIIRYVSKGTPDEIQGYYSELFGTLNYLIYRNKKYYIPSTIPGNIAIAALKPRKSVD